MLAIIGKASRNKTTGAIEHYLAEFTQKLQQEGRFVYAWSFNPNEEAVGHVHQSLKEEEVFLYLPGAGARSDFRMNVVGFHHERDAAGTPCPDIWGAYCINDLKGIQTLGSTPHDVIHVWFLIDSIEHLLQPEELLIAFEPVFKNKYVGWGRNFFAFRQQT